MKMLFVLKHTVGIFLPGVKNVFVMFYNLPYSYPLPLIVSREVCSCEKHLLVYSSFL